ncbi:MAG: hypothetical protein AAB849_00310 [Patescibacteria group bacterium]
MRTLTRKEVSILVELLGGDEAARLMVGKARLPAGWIHPKYPELSGGQVEAFLNIALANVGIERLPEIMAGHWLPKWEEVIQLLVDQRGRCISEGLRNSVVDDNGNFHQSQPTLDTASITALLARHREFCPFPGVVFPTTSEVEERYHSILGWLNLQKNEMNGVKNLLNAPHFLGVLPQIPAGDHGAILKSLVEAAGRSYTNYFSGRQFFNNLRGDLVGKVEVVDSTRYHKLIRAVTEGSVVYVSFRACLQGFSIPADREQEARMPSRFILSGGWDTAADIIGYPEILARDFNTPGLDCAANFWGSADYSLYFKADDSDLDFCHRDLRADGSYSGGLLLLGPACR